MLGGCPQMGVKEPQNWVRPFHGIPNSSRLFQSIWFRLFVWARTNYYTIRFLQFFLFFILRPHNSWASCFKRFCLPIRLQLLFIKRQVHRGAWVTQLVEGPILAFSLGCNLGHEIKACMELHAWDSLFLSPSHSCSSLSLSNK